MAIDDLENICVCLQGIAKEAGDLILAGAAVATTIQINAKKNSADIVTETDQAVEKFLSEQLRKRYPSFAFIGEETYTNETILTDIPTFIIDPIDGTSNFVHGFPAVCVSIGLVINKLPAVGVVYNPFTMEIWSASKGHGAFLQHADGKKQQMPIVSRPIQGFESACIGIEWGSDREGPNFELNLKVFTTLARTRKTGGKFVNSLRCTGSAAITICRVAAGQQEAFWECGSWAWDVAAAWCILTEAGGVMVDGHPGNWNPPVDNRRYLAVRPALGGQHDFIEEFWSIIGQDRTTFGP